MRSGSGTALPDPIASGNTDDETKCYHPLATLGESSGNGQGNTESELEQRRTPEWWVVCMKLADVEAKFRAHTCVRFKSGSRTADMYMQVFRRFWKHAKADGLTRAQLSKHGRDLLLAFMNTVPSLSRRTVLAALECVWVEGSELAWPINRRRDFGKTLPEIGSRTTPRNEVIKPWFEAVQKEEDPMTKAMVLMLLQYGLRPGNQVGHLRWRNVRWAKDHVTAIVANGAKEDFKSRSWVIAYAFPDVAAALEAWHVVSPKTAEDDFIFVKQLRGQREQGPQQMGMDVIREHLLQFEQRHHLAHLQLPLLRHWVKTTCRELSNPALAALQGHKVLKTGDMRSTYDTPDQDTILDEQQKTFPNGPLGAAFNAVVVKMDEDLTELAALWQQFKAGRMTLSQFSDRASDLKAKVAQQSFVVPR